MNGGLCDLLLDMLPFGSNPTSCGWRSLWGCHPLQKLLDGMDSLICILHHFFKLGLPTHYLGEVDVSWSHHCLLSKPLRRIRGLRLVLTARWLVLRLALGTSSFGHLDSGELGTDNGCCW